MSTSHAYGPAFFEKQLTIFSNILDKINESEKKVFNMLDPHHPKGIKDLVFKGLFFKEEFITTLNDRRKTRYYFFETNMIISQIRELLEQGKIFDVGNDQWIINSTFF